jgi:hexosaminidase
MWEPTNYIEGISKENILGIEAPLWSETLTIIDDIEFMLFPRMPGYAEIGWSPPTGRNWDEYKVRLASHGKRFKALEINFYPSEKVNWDE